MTCTQTAELNSVTIDGSDGADFMLMESGIEGLGLPEASNDDLARSGDHGAVAGTDYMEPRVLRVPVMIWRESDPEAAMAALRTLKTAWSPTTAGAPDQLLTVTSPGLGPTDDALRFYGRPRGGDVQLQRLKYGLVYVQLTFVALDPVGYGPGETTAGSGTFAVTNDGDAVSKRAVVELVGNGGVPQLVNADDGGADVRFTLPLGGGSSWFVDLAARTVVDSAGDDVFPGNVVAASLWPRLVPGANNLTVTGAASASVDFQGGWW